ncbi:hypothetical protein NTGBS_1050017 [Candidatus Nitrotoga sp. BS]|uniref:TIR domain-containing protein n=1 Tax=Candidatus Nitrotoga sp. BS TaxID=2890408 RepID=UPI001EF1CBB9|nr:TIR domain-containing protein [Candidatus Nitrotoga sp. BS]CAH1189573.1 hypothetical protein NTGBS_1050017 [Candidatus Nitrotoga sp. BS]
MAQVFLSYARADRDFTLQLAGALRVYQISYWFDERVDFGDEWWQKIEQEIKECKYFVLVMTPDAASSRWVKREIHVADHYGKSIRPILLRGEPFSMFLGTQYIRSTADKFVEEKFFYSISDNTVQKQITFEPTQVAHEFNPKEAIQEQIKLLSHPVNHPESVLALAIAAANGNAEIGGIVVEALEKAKRHGPVVVEKGHAVRTTVESVSGLEFASGYLSPYFITDQENQTVVLYDPCILVFDGELNIDDLRGLLPLLEEAAKEKKAIVFIARSFDAELLATFAVNAEKKILEVAAFQVEIGDENPYTLLADIALITNTTVSNSRARLEDIKLSSLGKSKKLRSTADATAIIGGARSLQAVSDEMSKVNFVASNRCGATNEKDFFSRLRTGIVLIKVGGKTIEKIQSNMNLIQQSLNQTRLVVYNHA